MTNQATFVERTPEEKKAWVVQQRALGNKNILSERDLFKKNETRIMLENLDKNGDIMKKWCRQSTSKTFSCLWCIKECNFCIKATCSSSKPQKDAFRAQ